MDWKGGYLPGILTTVVALAFCFSNAFFSVNSATHGTFLDDASCARSDLTATASETVFRAF